MQRLNCGRSTKWPKPCGPLKSSQKWRKTKIVKMNLCIVRTSWRGIIERKWLAHKCVIYITSINTAHKANTIPFSRIRVQWVNSLIQLFVYSKKMHSPVLHRLCHHQCPLLPTFSWLMLKHVPTYITCWCVGRDINSVTRFSRTYVS